VRIAAVVLAIAAFLLCGWQVSRDGQRTLGREAALRVEGAPVLGPEAPLGDDAAWRIVAWSGHYEGGAELVAQRLEGEQRGYGLVQRFVREDGQSVLVDRGWIAADGVAAKLAEAGADLGPTRLTGQLRALEGDSSATPVIGHGGTRIWPWRPWPAIQAATGTTLPWYVVAGGEDGARRAGELALDGFVAVPERDDTSLHYASQWFAIGCVGLLFAVPGLWPRVRAFLSA
jgi:cytochrome oxidase assembly protein ShyY1